MSAGTTADCAGVRDDCGVPWPLSPEKVFDFLLGSWRFERVVPQQATMRGQATISLCSDGTALYDEVARVRLLRSDSLGNLRPSAASLRASQRYVYVRWLQGLDICFYPVNDLFQRLQFHTDEASGLFASAQHLCGQDAYHSDHRICDRNSFRTIHRVSGPRKDYEIRTLYRRLDEV